jgi:tRNA/rRNA methyltransferase
MANTGLSRLILVQPAVDLGGAAFAFAVGARRILEEAQIVDSLPQALAPFQRVIGTTSARSREPSAPLVAPRELPGLLASDSAQTESALVFGFEPSGLTNEELAHCGWLVTIPCSPQQPTLNLSQAVLILAYELFLARQTMTQSPAGRQAAASTDQIEGMFEQVSPVLETIGFARDDTFAGVLRELRQLASRAGLTEREVSLLRGICRRAQRSLERS